MRWISIKDRLPPQHTYVLTWEECVKSVKIKWVFSNVARDIMPSNSRFYKVTHWMPLPDEPRKDRDEINNSNPNFEMAIEELEMTVRTTNCLRCHSIKTLGDLMKISKREFLEMANPGRKSLIELTNTLLGLGLELED